MADPIRLLVWAGCAAAILTGMHEWQRTPHDPEEGTARKIEPIAAIEAPPQAINSLAAYDAIVERPLFNPTRRAQDPEQATRDKVIKPPSKATDVSGWRLSAVLREADQRIVLIEDQAGRTQTLKQGDRLGDWKVEEIGDDQVTIVTGAQRRSLSLHQFDRPVKKVPKRPAKRPITRRPVPKSPQVRRAPAEDSGS